MSKMTVSLGQMQVIAGDFEHNRTQAQQIVAEAARRQSSVVVLPELFSTGYVLDEAQQHASHQGDGMFSEMSAWAAEGKLAVVGSIMEHHGDGVANCMAYFNAEGDLQGVYRKMHLFRLFDEDKYLEQGDAPLTLDLEWGHTGFAICYDLRFPEIFRRYAVKEQARVIVLAAEWPLVRVEHWRALLIARAIENQCYVIATNAAGDTGDTVMAGHSMIIDPWGQIVVEAGASPQLLTAEIDLAEVDKARGKIPVYDDLRHDLYSY